MAGERASIRRPNARTVGSNSDGGTDVQSPFPFVFFLDKDHSTCFERKLKTYLQYWTPVVTGKTREQKIHSAPIQTGSNCFDISTKGLRNRAKENSLL